MSRLLPTRCVHVRMVGIENEAAYALKETLKICSDVKAFIIKVIDENYEELKTNATSHLLQTEVSKLIHTTKHNVAVYPDFDKLFYKLPCYLRRSLIHESWSDYCLYKENHEAWDRGDSRYRNSHGKRSREPMLKLHRRSCPSMYKGNMYKPIHEEDGKYVIEIKLFNGKNWSWFKFKLNKSNVEDLNKKVVMSKVKVGSPSIIRKSKTYSLAIPVTRQLKLEKVNVEETKVLAVDLGYSKLATCCVMDSNGTILSRHFIRASHEIDHMESVAKRIEKAQSQGAKRLSHMYALLNNVNDELTRRTIHEVVELAKANDCSVIVLEHLNFKGSKMGGRGKTAISMRRYAAISEGIETQAHFFGIRVNRVCAAYTSLLAFDGTGFVRRGDEISSRLTQSKFGYGQVEFRSGKLYDADLNASYNIGARWFIREKLKQLSDDQLNFVQAKVPETKKRSTCTLDTLKTINEVLSCQ